MLTHLLLSLVLLLQATPQIHWKSEVRESPDGNRIVLTGELDPGIDHVTGTVSYMPCKGEACYLPEDWDFEEFFTASGGALSSLGGIAVSPVEKPAPRAASTASAERQPASETGGAESLWALILEAILWGFAMLLTPCVFPMVPMTVSFFMKGSESPRQGRLKAFLYGLFIVLLYTVPISLIIGITWVVGGSGVTADIFNWLSTHWLPNILFFLVFMVFAASFFGAFEITLPSRWTNGADRNSDRGGLGGIFFLALTLVLVSFSCTGPIVGTVLIKSTQGEFWTPMVTMLAFSVAFALPFTVLALFPSLLKKLPKSGGWLNSVKVVLGFIEIALGLKFLSVADQTYHWHLLDREVYLAIWIAVFFLLGLYLIGKIRFKNDSPLEYLSVGRLALAIAVFSFVVYLIPGMWGAPLKALSGYLPPMETQDFVLGSGGGSVSQAGPTLPLEEGMIRVAHDLPAYDNLPDGLAAAKAAGKPVFLDFTGYGCVNCREMEARVWSDPEVLRRLREDFVIVALHVDDKTRLPESRWVTTDNGKTLKDIGRVNSYIALHDFGVNAQPNYFLLDGDGNRLAGPRPYDLDVRGFVEFLDSAL
ncbi:MAG: thioredoxin family protein [Bacteroidales bacterium]|nr:thioredoxin family protein [Bacteroidales bacterium]